MKKVFFTKLKSAKALFAVTLTMLFFSPLCWAELSDDLVLCKNNKSVRTLRVEQKEQKCKAIYTKHGVDEVIGTSQTAGACAEFISKVRKNLEDAKWSCREVKEARTSNIILDAE